MTISYIVLATLTINIIYYYVYFYMNYYLWQIDISGIKFIPYTINNITYIVPYIETRTYVIFFNLFNCQ